MTSKLRVFSYKSPNGTIITGTYERTDCECFISGISDDGVPEYEGGSDMWWDETHPVERDGKPLFIDENGDMWTFDELTKIEEV